MVKKDDEIKNEKEEISRSEIITEQNFMKSSTFGDVALQTLLAPSLNNMEDLKIKSDDIKTPLIPDDTKIKSQSELISILEDGNENKMEHEKLKDFPKIDLNTMMISNNLDDIKSQEIKQEDEIKENSLNSITGGLLSSGSLDLTLSQSDLERLSTLAQLSDVTGNPQPNIPQPEAAIDPSDCRMNLLEHIEYFQNLVDEKLNVIEAEITGNYFHIKYSNTL